MKEVIASHFLIPHFFSSLGGKFTIAFNFVAKEAKKALIVSQAIILANFGNLRLFLTS